MDNITESYKKLEPLLLSNFSNSFNKESSLKLDLYKIYFAILAGLVGYLTYQKLATILFLAPPMGGIISLLYIYQLEIQLTKQRQNIITRVLTTKDIASDFKNYKFITRRKMFQEKILTISIIGSIVIFAHMHLRIELGYQSAILIIVFLWANKISDFTKEPFIELLDSIIPSNQNININNLASLTIRSEHFKSSVTTFILNILTIPPITLDFNLFCILLSAMSSTKFIENLSLIYS